MSWAPDGPALQQLAQLLAATLNARDRTKQKSAEITLKQAKTNPDINNYLTYLTTHSTSIPGLTDEEVVSARSAAGLMLKNHVRTEWKTIADTSKAYVKGHILDGLQDNNFSIRMYTGMVITEIVRQGGLLAWAQVLGELLNLIETVDGSVPAGAQDGAMAALLKICEDNKKALNKVYQGDRPLDGLVPKLIDLSGHSNPKVRWKSLAALNAFMDLDNMPEALQTNAETILLSLFHRAHDQDEEVRRYVCRLFTTIASGFPTMILPHFEGIVDYILSQQKAGDSEGLALDAAEFFFEINEKLELHKAFESQLPKIIPVLLESMRYDEDNQARLEAEAEEDAGQEDREQDIKPQFANAKDDKGQHHDNNSRPDKGYAFDDDDSDGEIDDEDEDPEEEWNLRKCSAASLDYFANNFGKAVFESVLPYLKENLGHSEWPNREAAVLTLGAIATGCMSIVEPNLPELVPYLLSLLNDPQPVVRRITCWTLGRYSSWAANLDAQGKKSFFEPTMEGLLQHMLDRNKGVQKAAISAFASLEDQAKGNLKPYAPVISQQFAKCFETFKDQNMYFLYDCVQTLSESLGPDMAEAQVLDVLMPAIIKRWHVVQDESREMFPLLECLGYLAASMGRAFSPFAEPLFGRCVRIIQNNLEESNAVEGRPSYEQPDKDFLVTSLDLLSSILQAVGEQQGTVLMQAAQPNVFELLSYCMRDSNNDVRQSAYALLGDCAINVYPLLQPYATSLLQISMLQLDLNVPKEDRETVYRVINNACWSGGELAMRARGGVLDQLAEPLLQALANIMFKQKISPSLNENAAVAIGRLGFHYSSRVAPHLGQLAPTFITVMQRIPWTDEKHHALQGFTNMVNANPQGLEQCLPGYLSEVGNCILQGFPPPEGSQQLLDKYASMIGDFGSFLSNLPPLQLQALQQNFTIL